MLDLINTSSTREIDKDIYINVNSCVDVCTIVTVGICWMVLSDY